MNHNQTGTPHLRSVGPSQYVSPVPDIADLVSHLLFSPGDGRIRLGHQRMLLIHASAIGALRRELTEGLGTEQARGLLTRMGHSSGVRDAEFARKLRRDTTPIDAFFVGAQLHSLEGFALVEPVRVEVDVARGTYYGEYIWKGSSEDEEHVSMYAIGEEAMCWMQIGYACGYASAFMGRPILYRETECRATGNPACRIIGKPVDEWDDAVDDLRFFQTEAFSKGLSARVEASKPIAQPLSAGLPTTLLDDDKIVGMSTAFNAVCHALKRVAPTRATVLLLGETGVGKDIFARTLHQISPRADRPFVAVNCAAIPEPLIESELFGVDKGAFTGALQTRIGRFERAHCGTLFLDEIGILSLTAQGKLLRALQGEEIERVGGSEVRNVDVRVVAATNLDLKEEVKAGRFREDLYFRLNVFPIRVPPLRERREDIPLLMLHFLNTFSQRHGRQVTGFTARAIDALLNYEWPGNIRELENMIERGVILGPDGGAIDLVHLFTSGERVEARTYALSGDGSLTTSLSDDVNAIEEDDSAARVTERVSQLLLGKDGECDAISLDEIENALLKSAVQHANGNLSAAARVLGLTRPQLAYRLKARAINVA